METLRADRVSRTIVAVAALALVACGSDDDGAPATVRSLADARGVFVGAGFVEGSHTREFREIVGREYNSLTAPLYWTQSEPERGRFDFTAADDALEVAELSGLRVRGHPLVWGRLALPDYVDDAQSAEELRSMMRGHITAIATRYRGRIAQYDVVNEPITFFGAEGEGGDGLESYVFTRLLGADYIGEALELVHEVDPDAKLFINEFFALKPGPKQDFLYALASRLVEQGAPLHGVGFQGHFTPPFNPSYLPTRAEMEAAIDRFGRLGLEVEITEIDVTLSDLANDLDRQAAVYRDVTEACFASLYCRGITTWGISDAYSWIEAFFGVRGAPLPFDESFEPKPAWTAIRDGLIATR